ncbi:MAG: DUF1287 domain-containing protein [Elusimicrobia bacterium]|nr:DUF1287 domain-containing protein [Elusimicrobiota bacterium]
MKRFIAISIAVLSLILVGTGFALVLTARAHSYHGPTEEPASWDGSVDRGRVVVEARKLIGLWYDPFQGYLNNIGGRMGLIVCMDVPTIAYRNSGTSIRRLLEADYKKHPEHYGKRDGRPGDPFFDRRARNLYSYCKFNGCLDMKGPPEPGDVVFMSHSQNGWVTHIALVSAVAVDGSYDVVEASRDEWYVTRENAGAKMLARGWIFRGFGKPLPAGRGSAL